MLAATSGRARRWTCAVDASATRPPGGHATATACSPLSPSTSRIRATSAPLHALVWLANRILTDSQPTGGRLRRASARSRRSGARGARRSGECVSVSLEGSPGAQSAPTRACATTSSPRAGAASRRQPPAPAPAEQAHTHRPQAWHDVRFVVEPEGRFPGALPMRISRSRSVSRSAIADAQVSGSCGGSSRPVISSSTSSGPPPTSLTISGVRIAMLSSITLANGSSQEGRRDRSRSCRISGTSGRCPRKCTLS